MRVALIPLRTVPRDPIANRREVERRLEQLRHEAPDLVCFPETTLTGYCYQKQDFNHFAEPVPGPTSSWFGELARKYGVYLCAGLLERLSQGVYDTALLFDPNGRIMLHHRKIEEKPPFLCGDGFRTAITPLGRLGILICGDLFCKPLQRKAAASADWLLVPMSRAFDGRSPDLTRWEQEERQAYLEAIRAYRAGVFLVNALEVGVDEPAFGGALIVNANGTLLGESSHGTDHLLIWDSDDNEIISLP